MSEKRIDQWRRAIRFSDLPPAPRSIAIELCHYMHHDDLSGARPGPSRLADRTGWSVPTVKRALQVLVNRGWLKRTHKGGFGGDRRKLASTYRGTFPRDRSDTGQSDPETLQVSERPGFTYQADTPSPLRTLGRAAPVGAQPTKKSNDVPSSRSSVGRLAPARTSPADSFDSPYCKTCQLAFDVEDEGDYVEGRLVCPSGHFDIEVRPRG